MKERTEGDISSLPISVTFRYLISDNFFDQIGSLRLLIFHFVIASVYYSRSLLTCQTSMFELILVILQLLPCLSVECCILSSVLSAKLHDCRIRDVYFRFYFYYILRKLKYGEEYIYGCGKRGF